MVKDLINNFIEGDFSTYFQKKVWFVQNWNYFCCVFSVTPFSHFKYYQLLHDFRSLLSMLLEDLWLAKKINLGPLADTWFAPLRFLIDELSLADNL